jgi:putative ABC transport system substrate-binding protein
MPGSDRSFLSRWTLGAVVLVTAILSGCGGSDGGDAAGETMKRVGLMHVGTDHIPPSLGGLKAGLAELGWKEGENIELIFRNLEPEQAAAQARAFVLDRVDVIVAFEDKSIEEAQKATSDEGNRIPIVFLHPTDPVRDGLVESLGHPNSNLTGVYGARDELDKQLELYQLLVPKLQRVLALVDPTDKRTERSLKSVRAAAAELERPLELVVREATTAKDIERVFRSLRPGDVDGVLLVSPALRLNRTRLTSRLARKAGLPIQAHRREWVEQGALFSYGIDTPLIGHEGARYVDSLLRGTPPADLPVDEISKIEFAINLKTAARLGIQVPQEMITRAEYVYR